MKTIQEKVNKKEIKIKKLKDKRDKLNKFILSFNDLIYPKELLSKKEIKFISKVINKLENDIQKYSDKIIKLNDDIYKIREKCKHKYMDGTSALELEGHDSHYDWYVCKICGKDVKC